jgi:hypothetical protein
MAIGGSSSLTDFSAKTISVEASWEAEQVESTTFGDTYREYEQSFKNGTIEVEYKFDATIFAQLAAIYNGGDTVIFELGPTGTTATYVQIEGSMFITELGMPVEIGELLAIPVTFQVTGAVTFGTF